MSANTLCENCTCNNSEFKCSGCNTTMYCGVKCQIEHWSKIHKYLCIGGEKRGLEETTIEKTTIKLESADGVVLEIPISLAEKQFPDIYKEILQSYQSDDPFPMKINGNVLESIINFLENGTLPRGQNGKPLYERLIVLIKVGAYLGIEEEKLSFLGGLFKQSIHRLATGDYSRTLKEKETYDSFQNGFSEDEMALINDPNRNYMPLLDDISDMEPILSFSSDVSSFYDGAKLTHLSKNILRTYILPLAIDYADPCDFWRDMLEFRKLHKYFWHTTTAHMIDQLTLLFGMGVVYLHVNVRFEFMWRFCNRSNDEPTKQEKFLMNFGITQRDVNLYQNEVSFGDDLEYWRLLYVGLRVHKTFEAMIRAANESRQKANKRKDTTIARKSRRLAIADKNVQFCIEYFFEKGFIVNQTDVRYLIDLDTDTYLTASMLDKIDKVQNFLEQLKRKTKIDESTTPQDLLKIQTQLTIWKYKEIFENAMPNLKAREAKIFNLARFLKERGFVPPYPVVRDLIIKNRSNEQALKIVEKAYFNDLKEQLLLNSRSLTKEKFAELINIDHLPGLRIQYIHTSLVNLGLIYNSMEISTILNKIPNKDRDTFRSSGLYDIFLSDLKKNKRDLGYISQHTTPIKFLEIYNVITSESK